MVKINKPQSNFLLYHMGSLNLHTIVNYYKPLTSVIFTIEYFTVLHALARYWMLIQSSVGGATLVNEFLPYAMLALPPLHEMHSSKVYS